MTETKPMNQRVMLTKRLLHQALLELLKAQNINKISIRELCQVAGINRSTFYNHYGSQYDVLNEIAEDYIQSTSFAAIQAIKEGRDFRQCFIEILTYIKDHAAFAKLILKQDNYDLISQIKISLPQFDKIVIDKLPEDISSDQKEALASYVQYGTVRLLKEWVLTDCLKSPEEEADLLLCIIGRTMR